MVGAVTVIEARAGYVITHPNRDKASSKTMRIIVVGLLLLSALLVLVILIGGWDKLIGMKFIQAAWAVVYLVMAFFVARWNRGVLPMAAALAVLLAIFAGISGPEWLARDKPGFDSPTLDDSVLGILTLLVVPLQLLLVAAAMVAFRQEWSVEVEVPEDQYTGGATARRSPAPAPAA